MIALLPLFASLLAYSVTVASTAAVFLIAQMLLWVAPPQPARPPNPPRAVSALISCGLVRNMIRATRAPRIVVGSRVPRDRRVSVGTPVEGR